MNGELQVCEWEDLNQLEKSVAIVKLYCNNELLGEGTIKEIAEKIGRTENSIYVSLHRSKEGLTKFKTYHVELAEWVRYPYKEYELLKEDTVTGIKISLATGTINEISECTGYDDMYLRRLSSSKCVKYIEDNLQGVYKKRYKIYIVEVDMDE